MKTLLNSITMLDKKPPKILFCHELLKYSMFRNIFFLVGIWQVLFSIDVVYLSRRLVAGAQDVQYCVCANSCTNGPLSSTCLPPLFSSLFIPLYILLHTPQICLNHLLWRIVVFCKSQSEELKTLVEEEGI